MKNMELERAVRNACHAYKGADKTRWVAAYWAAQIVGKYDRGATLALATEMGVSPDTVENLARAYRLYDDLRKCNEGEYLHIVSRARKHPKVYMSHFVALFKARETYNLNVEQVISILVDVVQLNGQLSSRDVDNHVQARYGVVRSWTYYAQRAQKEIGKTLMCPDLPVMVRKVLNGIYEVVGDQA